MSGTHGMSQTGLTTPTMNYSADTQTASSETGKISFETISNLYLSAVATQEVSGDAGGGYPDLSVIAGLYKNAAGDDGIINSEAELTDVMNKIEEATGGLDLFEFDDVTGKNNGTNEHSDQANVTAATEKKGIDADGVLLDSTCPVTGGTNCTCKVTDGFADVTAMFKALANDTEINTSVMEDGDLSEEEQEGLIKEFSGKTTLTEDDLGLETTASEALNMLNQGKTIAEILSEYPESKTEITSYLASLTPEAREAKLTAIYGSIENAQKALGNLLPQDDSISQAA